jgi:hypothetical protein
MGIGGSDRLQMRQSHGSSESQSLRFGDMFCDEFDHMKRCPAALRMIADFSTTAKDEPNEDRILHSGTTAS